jgi:Zn-dependent metalloprotease
MKHISIALVLVLALATVAFAGARGKKYGKHTIHGMNYDRAAVEKLLDDSEAPAEVTADERGVQKLKGKFKLDKSMNIEDAAVDFIDRHRDAFKLKDPKKELRLDEKKVHKEGDTHIYYEQTYNDVPIWQAMVTVHLDKDNDIDRISSGNVPTPDIDTTPLVTKEEAMGIVKRDLKIPENVNTGITETELVIYNDSLSYRVVVSEWLYFVDAKSGSIISKEDLIRYYGPE